MYTGYTASRKAKTEFRRCLVERRDRKVFELIAYGICEFETVSFISKWVVVYNVL
jgi:hypothetical protein